MSDRDEVYQSRKSNVPAPQEPVEVNRVELARHIAQSARLLKDAFIEVGFSENESAILCGQVLPKLL